MGHPPPPAKWELRRNRNGDEHRNKCKKGYIHLSTYSNIHHIVCVSSMADGTIKGYVPDDAQFEFIQNCLAVTNWNINDEPNVVGLPKKQAYVDKAAEPPSWDGWACHQVDHHTYLTKVSQRLFDQIWVTCQDVAQDCKVKGTAIAGQLKDESDYWLKKLGGRGTAVAWATRENNPDTWYKPFSMDHISPSKRKPPPDWAKNFSSKMLSRLSELFEMVI
jgi:hypothetical protein